MKRKKIFFAAVIIMIMTVMAFFSCSSGEEFEPLGGKIRGNLSYEWSSSLVNDTVYLTCRQVLTDGEQTFYPTAQAKFYALKDTVYYAAGLDPSPASVNTTSLAAYQGINPRRRVITKTFELKDGQVVIGELAYDIYSYINNGSEILYPHIAFEDAVFYNGYGATRNGIFMASIDFSVTWKIEQGDGKGSEMATFTYPKKKVAETDKVLQTTYTQGIDWVTENTFSLYVEKTEIWQIAGTVQAKTSSTPLSFALTANGAEKLSVTDFDFVGKDVSEQSLKQDFSQDGWVLKKGTTKHTLMFSNNAEYFEQIFSYPQYEASLTLNGRTFDFDLSVNFSETHGVTNDEKENASFKTVGTAVFGGKTFTAAVLTTLEKKQTEDPDPGTIPITGSKHGKVLDYCVSAVFDLAALNSGGSITKKCVLIRYEKGYDWGICAYGDAFPASFTFTESSYSAFNSAAMRNETSSFELARATENASSIRWYDAENAQLAGIDGLTCLIRGWANSADGHFSYVVQGYEAQISDNLYTITLQAPDGSSITFNSSP